MCLLLQTIIAGRLHAAAVVLARLLQALLLWRTLVPGELRGLLLGLVHVQFCLLCLLLSSLLCRLLLLLLQLLLLLLLLTLLLELCLMCSLRSCLTHSITMKRLCG